MIGFAPSSRSSGLKFVLLFGGLAGGGIAALLVNSVDAGLVHPFTSGLAAACAWAIRLFGGSAIALGQQLSLASHCGGVQVENGCNAVEASILLAAAILAYPAPLRLRAIGAVVGVGLLQMVNLLRIISLLYLSCYATAWFNFFHLYLWDAVIMLDTLMLFLGWYRWQRTHLPRAGGN